jgi:prevent-host-death family protein
VTREINQRELRNHSGEIMRQLDQGESFIVTRNGVPVGELSPLATRIVLYNVLGDHARFERYAAVAQRMSNP